MELFEPPDDLQFMLGESKSPLTPGYEAPRAAWVGTTPVCVRTCTGRAGGATEGTPADRCGCVVTHASSRLSRSLIRQAHRLKERMSAQVVHAEGGSRRVAWRRYLGAGRVVSHQSLPSKPPRSTYGQSQVALSLFLLAGIRALLTGRPQSAPMSRFQAQALVFTGPIWTKTLVWRDFCLGNARRKALNPLKGGWRRESRAAQGDRGEGEVGEFGRLVWWLRSSVVW